MEKPTHKDYGYISFGYRVFIILMSLVLLASAYVIYRSSDAEAEITYPLIIFCIFLAGFLLYKLKRYSPSSLKQKDDEIKQQAETLAKKQARELEEAAKREEKRRSEYVRKLSEKEFSNFGIMTTLLGLSGLSIIAAITAIGEMKNGEYSYLLLAIVSGLIGALIAHLYSLQGKGVNEWEFWSSKIIKVPINLTKWLIFLAVIYFLTVKLSNGLKKTPIFDSWTLFICETKHSSGGCNTNKHILEGYKSQNECMEKGIQLSDEEGFECGKNCEEEYGLYTCDVVCDENGCRD